MLWTATLLRIAFALSLAIQLRHGEPFRSVGGVAHFGPGFPAHDSCHSRP